MKKYAFFKYFIKNKVFAGGGGGGDGDTQTRPRSAPLPCLIDDCLL